MSPQQEMAYIAWIAESQIMADEDTHDVMRDVFLAGWIAAIRAVEGIDQPRSLQ